MSTGWWMVGAALAFSTMGVCVKWASAHYGAGELVLYRSLIGMALMAALACRAGGSLRSAVPAMHFWRSAVGATSLLLYFIAITQLPLGTAVTLNYTSSVWIALFVMGGAAWLGADRVDGRLVATVAAGFFGVALVLQPTIDERQLAWGVLGLTSGLTSAMAYLQVAGLTRAGEPEYRIVFYFSLAGAVLGAAMAGTQGWHAHEPLGIVLLLAVGISAAAGQWLMTRAYADGPLLLNASLQYLGIAFSFLFGVWLFDDPVTVHAVAGMSLIVAAGLAATLLRAHTPVRAPANPHEN